MNSAERNPTDLTIFTPYLSKEFEKVTPATTKRSSTPAVETQIMKVTQTAKVSKAPFELKVSKKSVKLEPDVNPPLINAKIRITYNESNFTTPSMPSPYAMKSTRRVNY